MSDTLKSIDIAVVCAACGEELKAHDSVELYDALTIHVEPSHDCAKRRRGATTDTRGVLDRYANIFVACGWGKGENFPAVVMERARPWATEDEWKSVDPCAHALCGILVWGGCSVTTDSDGTRVMRDGRTLSVNADYDEALLAAGEDMFVREKE